ncbi:MAG: excinuclease ABC subunit UvrB [Candidatus Pacebacteria bacterium]|nr:excinuclease ABC subunit UvrB [Candidatus Paceibacterota bacterium]
MEFKIKSKHKPAGDQPNAIESLVKGLGSGMKKQTLLGVTGSGKTFTAANVIAQVQKPTLVIAHNKTLAAQLAQEYRDFFPDNAVHYFVSYYDYYQPEAYMAVTDTYIEKEAQINEEIERLRHASTQALLTREDVIIVASVSCIYGLGSPEEYQKVNLKLSRGDSFGRKDLIMRFISMYYERTNADLSPGLFRVIGSTVEIMPANGRSIFAIEVDHGEIKEIVEIDPITRAVIGKQDTVFIFPAKHFVTNDEQKKVAIKSIEEELKGRLKELEKEGKLLEAERLKRRTKYDLAMIREVGYCSGIENYSRHFSGKPSGEAPDTLLSYFPKDFLTVIDESHVTVPQISGMYAGDASRKQNLVDHGFRLPSAKDNRPLRFEEFEERVGQVIYTSATPGDYEKEKSENVVEQVIRPTGLIDPVVDIFPVIEKDDYPGQVRHFISEAEKEIKKGGRVIATTLTKKMAEDLSEYLNEKGMKTEYLHSEIQTLDRIEILTNFRKGKFDCLVGVNLLREGLDLPEVSFIGILDADKEGFLRSETSLIQTIGRAARNVDGRVILYADVITGSMKRALDETERRRDIQIEYNKKHNITPKTIKKNISDITESIKSDHQKAVEKILLIEKEAYKGDIDKLIREKKKQMAEAVKALDFETAAIIRDELKTINEKK